MMRSYVSLMVAFMALMFLIGYSAHAYDVDAELTKLEERYAKRDARTAEDNRRDRKRVQGVGTTGTEPKNETSSR